ncbi:S8 family serine peptidase [Streptacidiphilus sp. 4-A2]|nr:S8 family serine peptidase [Streptacidiphilus sp. 4-A2]
MAKAGGATHITSFVLGDAFSATVSPALEAALAADPAVASVLPDLAVAPAPLSTAPTAPTGPVGGSRAKGQPLPQTSKSSPAQTSAGQPPAVCPASPSQPMLEPEALYSMHVVGRSGAPGVTAGINGAGVKVGLIADGLDADDPDFIRADGQHVVVDYEDFSGSGIGAPTGGAEAFGDASAIAAQGRTSYDLSQYVNPAYPLPKGCDIRIQGVAPGASLVVLKADGNSFTTSSILQAINYAVTVAHVDVLNESFIENETRTAGSATRLQCSTARPRPPGHRGRLLRRRRPDGTIGNPASDPNVISVGASTDSQLYEQTGYALARESNGTWADDNISALSSGGYTQTGGTVDLVAPGEADWALCTADVALYSECTNYNGQPAPIQAFGGTSQAAPLTAGTAALVIEAYRNTHHGASPTPALVKALLEGTADDLGLPSAEQGAGLVDARSAVLAAEGYQGGTGHPASAVAVTTGQIDITGHPGSAHTADVSVVNTGSRPATVGAATRTFAPLGDTQQTVQLNSSTTSSSSTRPTAPPGCSSGPPSRSRPGPRGCRVQGAAQPSGGSLVTPVVRLTLLDPRAGTRPTPGRRVVRCPRTSAPATWRTRPRAPGPRSCTPGRTGGLHRPGAAGHLDPADRSGRRGRPALAHHRPRSHRHLPGPTDHPGDQRRQFRVGRGQRLRRAADQRPGHAARAGPTAHGSGSFTGTITGGNARQAAQAQTSTYAFDVPPGTHDVQVGVTLEQDPQVAVQGVLISRTTTRSTRRPTTC